MFKKQIIMIVTLLSGLGMSGPGMSVQAESYLSIHTTEEYPQQQKLIKGKVVVDEAFMRIDGDDSTVIFDGGNKTFNVYAHASHQYFKITSDTLNKIKQEALAKNKGQKKLQPSKYRVVNTKKIKTIKGHKTAVYELFYGDLLKSRIHLARLDDLGIPPKTMKSLQALNQMFEGYLEHFPLADNMAFSGSLIGVPKSAGLPDDGTLPLQVVHFDAKGKIYKIVHVNDFKVAKNDGHVFEVKGKYQLQPLPLP